MHFSTIREDEIQYAVHWRDTEGNNNSTIQQQEMRN